MLLLVPKRLKRRNSATKQHMSKILVTLDMDELAFCAHTGVERRMSAMALNAKSQQTKRHYSEQNYWQSDIIGLIGEYAVAKAFSEHFVERPYDKNNFDVLTYQVRATEQKEPKLRVRAHNNFNHMYILAQVKNHRVLIHGWANGHDVKQYGILEYENCWSLPADNLNDMNALIDPIIYTDQVRVWKAPDYQ